ncbi:phosphoadenylyl-sulfate reductase [Commensalibacter papalotli (ex Botero et al. 2024)]|uniref:Adenosine 5'-phosphosulfate reductase n=1 Tax=Commensalibacter papalotli (ex Botero et al. 2024) TaxID=2972766 RepID=A0ABM9HSD4_9PROT|nr:phosphoadenylyl-sulfate reductase [Commensalibacter papalotli (ex Botero et al. 2024)]CAI3951904.1 3'-phosphoadenosine 5'-phosphosulfate sulfotransferase (PAPS reductase)/FAD synthetase or related enzyme (CysD) (PDB:1ZUN) [Commensalibacter papalotli (ex Botero et al. 2024)]CAI3955848.1 3'-phosphoadenosine 5'-phosphosulfate sulfotransferase (PAPS reductase)/FAD synthetase or related enzyme (CysD) (PDB:1ZUN) [Commensalibacter papalotli (ex Botero et al. 2024)]
MTPIELYSKKPSEFYERKLLETQEILKNAVAEYGQIVQATSLGVEDMVITDFIHRLGLPISIAMLDTKKLHQQTLDLKDQAKTHYNLEIKTYYPDEDQVAEYVKKNGENGIFESVELRKECCHIRKLVPLKVMLKGHEAWITGLRREQSNFRANLQIVEQENPSDATQPKVKINPLLDWTIGDIWHYVKENNVPYNPLHDQFYVSIGCEPCTRAIALGEDFRAGRWWWEQDGAKECGLHVHDASSLSNRPSK